MLTNLESLKNEISNLHIFFSDTIRQSHKNNRADLCNVSGLRSGPRLILLLEIRGCKNYFIMSIEQNYNYMKIWMEEEQWNIALLCGLT